MTTRTKKTDDTRIAILETKMSSMEARMAADNASIGERLTSIERGIKEIHDKIDQHMLHQAVEITELKVKHNNLSQYVEKLEAKIYKAASIAGTIVAAVITGGVQLFKSA